MSSPKISAIIPVYNCARYLDDLLGSIEVQSMGDFEVILVDDGSTDGGIDLMEVYAAKDSRFKVVLRENGGEGAARNTGLALARGEYVICLDADDICEPDMFAEMLMPFDNSNVDVVVCGADDYYDDTGLFKKVPWIVSESHVKAGTPFSMKSIENGYRWIVGYTWNKMIRKSLLDKFHITCQEIRTHGDLSFSYTALSVAREVVYVDKTLYHHRKRSDGTSLSDTTQDDLYECLLEALADLKHSLICCGCWDALERSFVNYALYMCRWKYNRVSPSVKMSVYDDLRNRWFRELGIADYPKEFYYDPQEYAFLRDALECSYVERANNEIAQLETKVASLKKKRTEIEGQNRRIRSSGTHKLARKMIKLPSMIKRTLKK